MNASVVDKKVAILATDGFEQAELESPLEALKASGAVPKIVSLKGGKIQATVHGEKGDKFDVDLTLEQAELESPLEALKASGAVPKIVSLKGGKIQATVHGEKGDKFDVDLTLDQ